MKPTLYLALISLTLSSSLFAKARLGEYFLGFGYAISQGHQETEDLEGEFLRFSASSPNNGNSDLQVNIDYGTMENNGTDTSTWNLGIDYLTYSQGVGGRSFRFRPYLGVGIGFLDEERPISLSEDGFTWSILIGTELELIKSLSLHIRGRYFGLWSEFGENEFSADTGITWWFNPFHGLCFEYQRVFEAKLDYFTLKYLYTWK